MLQLFLIFFYLYPGFQGANFRIMFYSVFQNQYNKTIIYICLSKVTFRLNIRHISSDNLQDTLAYNI